MKSQLTVFVRGAVAVGLLMCSAAVLNAGAYQDAVLSLQPTYYFELNETDSSDGIVDTMGNVAPGVLKGNYDGGAEIGIPGPDSLLFEGAWTPEFFNPDIAGIRIPLPGLGEGNTAHASNNVGHIDLGDSDLFGSPTMTVSMFVLGGPANGGDRLFTNNLADATRSFQMVVGNDGLVVSVDPNDECADEATCKHRSLFFPEIGVPKTNEGADRGLNSADNGWWHVIASTTGETSQERAENIRVWINGVNRTEDMLPGTTGWGRDTDTAKIGGRRDDPADSTTHSGAQDEVAIWLERDIFTDADAQTLFNAAVSDAPALGCDFDASGVCSLSDLDALYGAIGTNNGTYDLDGSGTVDAGDIGPWLNEAGTANIGRAYIPGDANFDGIVEAADLNDVGINWQSTEATSWSQGDFNGDGNVNALDLNDLGVNWQSTGAAAAAAVPEPSGIALALIGMLFVIRRKR